jgi:hypothetical protein
MESGGRFRGEKNRRVSLSKALQQREHWGRVNKLHTSFARLAFGVFGIFEVLTLLTCDSCM